MYIVPTSVVEQELIDDHAFYLTFPGRNGKPRTKQRNTRNGVPRSAQDNQADTNRKYAPYKDAWHLLK